LIGNKSDVSDRREVSREEAEELARQYNMRYIETSAKASQQVAETFEALALDVQQYVTRYDDE
jgi:GTPase SAR1 family protein